MVPASVRPVGAVAVRACSMATTPLRMLAARIASVTAVAAYALPLKLNIVVAIGTAVLLCFWLEKQLGLDPDAEDNK